MPLLTTKLLMERYPDFEVTARVGHGCGRRYYVVHRPSGYWASCILTKLTSVESLIQSFEEDKHHIGYWRPKET